MILAVLARKAQVSLGHSDVYVSTVGGARVTDPASDLAVAIAMASASLNHDGLPGVVALGEVGLAGDVRRVPGLERRLAEAAGWDSRWRWCLSTTATRTPGCRNCTNWMSSRWPPSPRLSRCSS